MLKQKMSFHQSLMDHIKRLLVSRNIPSSYIFSGHDGSGRDYIAQVFSKILLCEDDELFYCDVCKSCKLFDEGRHPGHLTVSEYKVQYFKNIRENAYKSPLYGERKVFVFERAENFNLSCANSILKLLEEPPENVFFLLTAQNIRKILPTIKSRCFRIDTTPDSVSKSMDYDLYYHIGSSEYNAFSARLDSLETGDYANCMQGWRELLRYVLDQDLIEKVRIYQFFYCIERYIEFLLDVLFNNKDNQYALVMLLADEISGLKKHEVMKKNTYLNFENEVIHKFLERLLHRTVNNNSLTMAHREHIINKVKKGLESLHLNINKELILLDVVNALNNEQIGN